MPIYFGQFAIYDLGTTVLWYTNLTLSEREMTETELRTMIDEGKSLSEIASEMAAGEYDVCSRETLLSYAISEIENDRLFLARHILDAVDSGEYADFYFYDITMGTLDTPLAIEGIGDLVDHIAE